MIKLIPLIVLTIFSLNVVAVQRSLVINSAVLESHQTQASANAQAMLVQAFSQLGIDVVFRYRPDKRSVVEANAGLVDGEFARISSITQDYQNLLLVPESIAELDIVAFSIAPTIDLKRYQIKQHSYHIGHLLGWKNIEHLLAGYQHKTGVGDHLTLFKLLVRNRVDVVLYTKIAGQKILAKQKIKIYKTSPSLLAYPVYLVLHKKHASLVPLLAAQLKRIKRRYPSNFRHSKGK